MVRSWLPELAEDAFRRDGRLPDIRGYIEDSGEGRRAVETGASTPVIAQALMRRFRSQKQDAFSHKVVAALRREFGGHAVVSAERNKQ